jgi:hypothetical protein
MEYDQIQKIYTIVSRGYDEINFLDEVFYLKHPRHSDKQALKEKYNEGIFIAQKSGVKTEKEYLDFFIEKNWWSKSKEDEIRTSKSFIESLNKSKSKLLLQSQKDEVQKTIDSEFDKLNLILNERKSIIPVTAEEYAEKYYNRYYLIYSLFKDAAMQKQVSSDGLFFEELSESEYSQLWDKLFNCLSLTKIENLKIVAASAFFQNLVILTGADFPIYNFYGKPVIELTCNQIDVFSFGSSYRKLINNTTERIPEDVLNNPEMLVEWCEKDSSSSSRTKKLLDRSPNQKNKRGERTGRMSSIVGATASDYKDIGVNESDVGSVDLLSAAKESGGELNIYGAIKKTDSATKLGKN